MKNILIILFFLFITTKANAAFYVGGNYARYDYEADDHFTSQIEQNIFKHFDTNKNIFSINLGYKYNFFDAFYISPEVVVNINNKIKDNVFVEGQKIKEYGYINSRIGYDFENFSIFANIGTSYLKDINVKEINETEVKFKNDFVLIYGLGAGYTLKNIEFNILCFKEELKSHEYSRFIGTENRRQRLYFIRAGVNYYF